MSKTERKYHNFTTCQTQLEKDAIEDIFFLTRKEDKISDLLAINLLENQLKGYNLVNKGVALLVVKAVADVYEHHGEDTVNILEDSLFEQIGDKKYPVGASTLLSRLKKKGSIENEK